MGAHKGWRVRLDKRRGTWRGLVWDPAAEEYTSKTFPDQRSAREWARLGAAQLATGVASVAVPDGEVATAEAAKDYLSELAGLGRAAGTLRDLRVILDAFASAVPRLDLPKASAETERWLAGLRSSGQGRGGKPSPVSMARRNKYLINVRALCRWCQRRRGLRVDPTADLRSAQVDQRLKPQFSVDELRKLVGGRDSATRRWVALMALAGLRSDEARTIRWGDLDWDGGVLFVRLDTGGRVKRRKERIVPLLPALREILHPMMGGRDERVCALGAGNLQRAWADYLTARKIQLDGRTPHSCRHTWAGLMTATGVPTALVGAYLGHTSAQTTMGYTQAAARYAMDPVVATWPRGDLRVGPS